MSQPQLANPAKKIAIRAILDVIDKLPPQIYGEGEARFLRRLVHVVLAKHANPDGTAIYPSHATLARECAGMSERTLRIHLAWLAENKLIRKLDEPHPLYRTVQYELLFPSDDLLAEAEKEHEDEVASRREAHRESMARWRATRREQDLVAARKRVTRGDCGGMKTTPVAARKDGVAAPKDDVAAPKRARGGMKRNHKNTIFPANPQAASGIAVPEPVCTALTALLLPPSLPPNTTARAAAKNAAGWLEERTEKLLKPKDTAFKKLTATERRKLQDLCSSADLPGYPGELTALIAFHRWLRERNLTGLKHPVSVFINECDPYLASATALLQLDDTYDEADFQDLQNLQQWSAYTMPENIATNYLLHFGPESVFAVIAALADKEGHEAALARFTTSGAALVELYRSAGMAEVLSYAESHPMSDSVVEWAAHEIAIFLCATWDEDAANDDDPETGTEDVQPNI